MKNKLNNIYILFLIIFYMTCSTIIFINNSFLFLVIMVVSIIAFLFIANRNKIMNEIKWNYRFLIKNKLLTLQFLIYISMLTFNIREANIDKVTFSSEMLMRICIFIIVFIVSNLLLIKKGIYSEFKHSIFKVLLIFLVIQIFNTIYAVDIIFSLYRVFELYTIVSYSILIVGTIKEEYNYDYYKFFVNSKIILIIIMFIFGLFNVNYIISYGEVSGKIVKQIGGLIHPNEATFIIIIIMFGVYDLLRNKIINHNFGKILILLSGSFILYNQSRTALFLCVFFSFIYLIKMKKILLPFVLFCFSGPIILFSGIIEKFISYVLRYQDLRLLFTLSERTEIWSKILENFKNCFFHGYGFASTRIIMPKVYPRFMPTNAHNAFLEALITSGWIGVVSLILVCLVFIRKLRFIKNHGYKYMVYISMIYMILSPGIAGIVYFRSMIFCELIVLYEMIRKVKEN